MPLTPTANIKAYCITVMSLAGGWAGWALAYLEFGSSVNPIPTSGGGGQIMPTTLLLPPPLDLKT